MPCTKCKDGKYKWGETGECKYDSLDACESANHKYSKMRPTPLGKKTYEEYEKELKEYNLSSQRFDFDSIKTLDRLLKESKAILKENDKISERYDKWTDIRNTMQKEVKNKKDISDKAIDNSAKVKKENDARLEKAVKEGKQDFQKYQEAAKLYNESVDEEEDALGDLKEQQKKAEAFEGQFKVQIADFQKAAKSLGVTVYTDKYTKAANSVNNL